MGREIGKSKCLTLSSCFLIEATAFASDKSHKPTVQSAEALDNTFLKMKKKKEKKNGRRVNVSINICI